jgi:hypothetical protein
MITPLLNQWLAQISTNNKSQSILLDKNAQVLNKIDVNGYNLTLIDRNKIAFLNEIGIEIYQRDNFF